MKSWLYRDMPRFVTGLIAMLVLGPFACLDPEVRRQTVHANRAVPVFVDRTADLGLDFHHRVMSDSCYFMPESMGSGAALFDYDNDGDLDIYLINTAPHHPGGVPDSSWSNRLYRQEEDGRFTDVTAIAGVGDLGFGMGAAVGDIDNDGDPDLYVTNYGADVLFRNNGDGTFSDISHLLHDVNKAWGSSAVFFDFDLDGFLDLYVANYVDYNPDFPCFDKAGRRDYCGPKAFTGVADVLYHNVRGEYFDDISRQSHIAQIAANGLGVVSADFDRDGYADLFVANDAEPNVLWINQRDGTFVDRALEFGLALNELGRPEASMGIAVGDVNNDLALDLFVSHLQGESNTLYQYAAEYGYEDRTYDAGLSKPDLLLPTGFGTCFLDFDHDGDLDLAVVNGRILRGPLLVEAVQDKRWDFYAESNQLFENRSSQFVLLPFAGDDFRARVKTSRGLACGDIDRDGDLDLLVSDINSSARLYCNEFAPGGNWIAIRAIDPALNRDAIGAEIRIRCGDRWQMRLVTRAHSYLSSHDVAVHFGVGTVNRVDAIEVTWPGGERESFGARAVNQFILIKKGEAWKTNPGRRL